MADPCLTSEVEMELTRWRNAHAACNVGRLAALDANKKLKKTVTARDVEIKLLKKRVAELEKGKA